MEATDPLAYYTTVLTSTVKSLREKDYGLMW